LVPILSNYICVHGHFYQPPRENPFTGRVEEWESAAPWHDWNERITAECYAANTRASILDGEGSVVRTVNNYERISFNFGPTLLSWLEDNAHDTYSAIVGADAVSERRFGGHGSAMAQAYNHIILPLANDRDQTTQVRWGIADFEHRFGRRPEGMWLPETAVDTRSLDVLAREGIVFTILSPFQASAVENEDGSWSEVPNGAIDTRSGYLVDLPEGRSITVFFYNGPLSHDIAFNGMLNDGRLFAARLVEAGDVEEDRPHLAHVATDGETYGHHHRHGEMALAVALDLIDADPRSRLTNYGEFLSLHPPSRKVAVIEDSSWSCAHGVERWRSNCGCATGRAPTGHQRWRAPLRSALDWLRDELIGPFEMVGSQVLHDPWAARDGYVEVILGGPEEGFLDLHALPGLAPEQREQALGLLEIQHRAMLMYTSCGWFFDDVSGLESVFVLRHAGRVAELAREVLGIDLEPELMARLEAAPSNVDGMTARDVYQAEVSPFVGRDP
jgi:alpha-amylase/alpha-mannosidase (GH57 family)